MLDRHCLHKERHLADDGSMYHCAACGGWHTTTQRLRGRRKTRSMPGARNLHRASVAAGVDLRDPRLWRRLEQALPAGG